MIGMMERPLGHSVVLKAANEFLVIHQSLVAPPFPAAVRRASSPAAPTARQTLTRLQALHHGLGVLEVRIRARLQALEIPHRYPSPVRLRPPPPLISFTRSLPR